MLYFIPNTNLNSQIFLHGMLLAEEMEDKQDSCGGKKTTQEKND